MPQFNFHKSTIDGLKMLAVITLTVGACFIGGVIVIFWLFDRQTLSLLLWMD